MDVLAWFLTGFEIVLNGDEDSEVEGNLEEAVGEVVARFGRRDADIYLPNTFSGTSSKLRKARWVA